MGSTLYYENVFIVRFANRQDAYSFYSKLLSIGVSAHKVSGCDEVQGVGLTMWPLLNALSEAGCAPVAVGVGSGEVRRWDGPSEASYGIQWGQPWYDARDMIERKI